MTIRECIIHFDISVCLFGIKVFLTIFSAAAGSTGDRSAAAAFASGGSGLLFLRYRGDKKLKRGGITRSGPRSGQKGFMAGGILFGNHSDRGADHCGLGTFLISKARTFVQNADFWTESISHLDRQGSVRRSRNSSSCREELSSAGSGRVQSSGMRCEVWTDC